jgi:hypothetical protein
MVAICGVISLVFVARGMERNLFRYGGAIFEPAAGAGKAPQRLLLVLSPGAPALERTDFAFRIPLRSNKSDARLRNEQVLLATSLFHVAAAAN